MGKTAATCSHQLVGEYVDNDDDGAFYSPQNCQGGFFIIVSSV